MQDITRHYMDVPWTLQETTGQEDVTRKLQTTAKVKQSSHDLLTDVPGEEHPPTSPGGDIASTFHSSLSENLCPQGGTQRAPKKRRPEKARSLKDQP